MTAIDQEPDPTEGIIFPWSDAEAEKIVDELIRLIGTEPQDVVEGERYNSETGLRERIWRAGRKHMRSELQAIGGNYGFEARWQDKPSPTEMIGKLRSIDSAAQRMLAALGIEPSAPDVLEAITPQELRYSLQGQAALMAEQVGGFANHPPMTFEMDGQSYTDWSQQSQLRDIVVGVRQLQAWAQATKERWSNRLRPGRASRHQGDVPLQMLIQDLFGLWIACYASVPKFSRDGHSGAPSGPFFRFVRGVCRALKIEATDEALGSRIASLLSGRRKLVMGHSVLRMGKSRLKKTDPTI